SRATLTRPPVHHAAAISPPDAHDALEARLNAAIDPWREPPIHLSILDGGLGDGAGTSALVLTWFHPLMDPRGAQNFLRHLSLLDRHPDGLPPALQSAAFVPPPDARSFRERGRLARQSRRHLRSLTLGPPVSPGTGLTAAGRARFGQLSWAEPA